MSNLEKQPETLLGKDITSDEVSAFLSKLDPKAKVKREDGMRCWYSRPAGLQLDADLDSKRITNVVFYAAGYDKCKQYGGVLPFGLRFDMTHQQMNAAVGSDGADNGEGLVWELPDFNLFLGENPKTKAKESFSVSGAF